MPRSLIRRMARALAAWLSDFADGPHSDTAEARAVRQAFDDAGLPSSQYSRAFDLSRAGKLDTVMKLAAARLGVDSEFSTVGDVIDWLESE